MSTETKSETWSPPDCSKLVKEVTRFKTADGKLFSERRLAESHQADIEEANFATGRLEAGDSIADILRQVGRKVHYPIFEQVTKDSKLVISHWQCRDTPGYQPVRFLPELQIYVHGDAGSWSGSYGGKMFLNELARYALDKRSVLKPKTK